MKIIKFSFRDIFAKCHFMFRNVDVILCYLTLIRIIFPFFLVSILRSFTPSYSSFFVSWMLRCVCHECTMYNSTKWNHFTNIKFNYVRFLKWQCVVAYLFIAPVTTHRHCLHFKILFRFIIQLWAAYIAWPWALLLNLYFKLSMLRPIWWWTLNEKLALIERREHIIYWWWAMSIDHQLSRVHYKFYVQKSIFSM